MKLISISKPGSFDRLRLVDAPAPKLGPGEVRVETRAIEEKFLIEHLACAVPVDTARRRRGGTGQRARQPSVAQAIEEARGVAIDRRHITVEPPIRAVGTYSVPVDLGPGLATEVKTIVSPLLD